LPIETVDSTDLDIAAIGHQVRAQLIEHRSTLWGWLRGRGSLIAASVSALEW